MQSIEAERHVIILGYGRNGQRLARLLAAEGVRYVALDLDPERVREAAAEQEYERAARLRDDIQALQRALEKQAVVLGEATDADVIALQEAERFGPSPPGPSWVSDAPPAVGAPARKAPDGVIKWTLGR